MGLNSAYFGADSVREVSSIISSVKTGYYDMRLWILPIY